MGTQHYLTKKLDGVQKEPPTCIKKAMSDLKRQESKQTKRQEPHKVEKIDNPEKQKPLYYILLSRIAQLGEKMKILIEIHQ